MAPRLREYSKRYELSIPQPRCNSLCFIPPSLRAKFEFQYIENGPLDEVGLEDPSPPLPYCFETEVLNKV